MHFSNIQQKSVLSNGKILLKDDAIPDIIQDETIRFNIRADGEIDCCDDKNTISEGSNFISNLDVCFYVISFFKQKT